MIKSKILFLCLVCLFIQSCGSAPKSAENSPVIKTSEIIKSKTFLGKFPRAENSDERSSKLMVGFDEGKFITVNSHKKVKSPNGNFTIILDKIKEPTGDIQRYSAFLKFDGKNKKQISNMTSIVVVSPDSKYVAVEPLKLINVQTEKSFDLSQELEIPNYITIHRWSKDGKNLIISQTDCAFDCSKDETTQYWKIELK